MSDHLPVMMDYVIDQTLGIEEPTVQLPVSITNPVGNTLEVTANLLSPDQLTFEIFTIDGKRLHQEAIPVSAGPQHLSFEFPYRPAFYLLKITDGKGSTTVRKVVKM